MRRVRRYSLGVQLSAPGPPKSSNFRPRPAQQFELFAAGPPKGSNFSPPARPKLRTLLLVCSGLLAALLHWLRGLLAALLHWLLRLLNFHEALLQHASLRVLLCANLNILNLLAVVHQLAIIEHLLQDGLLLFQIVYHGHQGRIHGHQSIACVLV